MTEQSNGVPLDAAVVTDRGLSEKRPVNEDSFLADPQRRIFAVADGVGGAQAGEVASKTAMEVLDEAFRHQADGADIEDLMEIAIQRANASIHQMALDQPRLSAMATTVVALHLDGRIATFGHVGDSRLYRLSPDGQLHRETADHSVVEEEVRAGRMTPEQAAHHPSRNVISRAVGAEPGVDVDMKTIEVADGTTFLLCSDGITRHIPDNEIRELLLNTPVVDEICAEMKRRCYDRGAEDNLTAVVVRVGSYAAAAAASPADDERTVDIAALHETVDASLVVPPITLKRPYEPTRITVPASAEAPPAPSATETNPLAAHPVAALESQSAPRRKGGAGRALFLLILLAGIGAGAFYGGMYFQQRRAVGDSQASPTPTAQPTPVDSIALFEGKRHEVDTDPNRMLQSLSSESAAKGVANPLESVDPEFLYLYGRALMLTGNYPDALSAFERTNETLAASAPPVETKLRLYDRLRVESRLATAAMAMKLRQQYPRKEQEANQGIEDLVKRSASPTPTP